MRDDLAVGRQVRDLRVSRNLRQSDVAERAGVSREIVSRLERGLIDALTIGRLRAISRALGAPSIVMLGWRMPELDGTRDRLHAAIVEAVCRMLLATGWILAPELGFNRYGERGSVDVLAWHPILSVLLIIEVKTRLWDLQDLFASTERKARVMPLEVQTRSGWRPGAVGVLLVMPDLSTHRHVVARHRATFQATFPARHDGVRRWLRNPTGDLRGLVFLPISQLGDIGPRSFRVRARRVPKKARFRITEPPIARRTVPDASV